MTSLFNLFCPLVFSFNLSAMTSLIILIFLSAFLSLLILKSWSNLGSLLVTEVFPGLKLNLAIFFSLFFSLSLFNLVSLSFFGFAVSSCFSFNFSLAIYLWVCSFVFLLMKKTPFNVFLPSNAPLSLSSFLSLVEFLSNAIRPITLSLRLLVNMSAGHLILSLVCKLSGAGIFTVGVALGGLELLVSIVQSFVFLMLVRVYFEENLSM